MKKILAVDNHPAMLTFMKNLLHKAGYEVRTAQDGLSALDVLKNYLPDVMFIDLVMPNIDGERLCRIIRSMPRFDETYLIVLSSIAVEKEMHVSAFGGDACIAKGPFNEMAEHILTALHTLGSKSPDVLRNKILGDENLLEREISKELISTNRHHELILDHMTEGIAELTRDGKIIYVNPSALSMLGMNEEALLGSRFVDFFDEKDGEKIQEIIDEVLQRNESRKAPEVSPIRLKGDMMAIHILPVQDENERPLIIIINNITEQKRMEDRLNHALKMESIGTLSGSIAHDFNNLLQGIQGNISLMLMDLTFNHPHYECLRKIEASINSGARLTRQLLGYARRGRYELSVISLNELVTDSAEVFGRTKREITIEKDLMDNLFPIEADPGQMEQMLLNIYVNAWQAMPGGGTLYLKTKNISHKNFHSDLFHPKAGDYVLLSVRDTGVGMDKKTQSRIFDPFFTTKEIGKGTGLGLTSVYGIVKGHGGYIQVESREGGGSTFMLYFPASGKDVAPKEKRTPDGFSAGGETILLVDDEEWLLDANGKILELLGFKVLTASNGKEAISTYREHGQHIDIVILDMVMPEIGGSEVYDRLKELNPHVRVLLSSGYSVDGQAMEIIGRGCNGFIQKPFDMKTLYEKILEILKCP